MQIKKESNGRRCEIKGYLKSQAKMGAGLIINLQEIKQLDENRNHSKEMDNRKKPLTDSIKHVSKFGSILPPLD